MDSNQQGKHVKPNWARLKQIARTKRQNPTPANARLWKHLRNRQIMDCKFRRQHIITPYIVDFYCSEARLVIDIVGESHDQTADYDEKRREAIEALNLRIIRFPSEDVLENTEVVLVHLSTVLKEQLAR